MGKKRKNVYQKGFYVTFETVLSQIMNPEISIQIILENPPAGVDFGIQKGKENQYETIQKQRLISGIWRMDVALEMCIDYPCGRRIAAK